MYNKITIIGNLGSDPEMRYLPSGDAVTSFSVATNRRYRNRDGENVDETEWFRVNAWGRLAETTNQYLEKGSLVYAEGRLSSRSWTGQDGQARFSNEIRALEIRFLGRAAGEGFSSSGAAGPDGPPSGDDDDDLPW